MGEEVRVLQDTSVASEELAAKAAEDSEPVVDGMEPKEIYRVEDDGIVTNEESGEMELDEMELDGFEDGMELEPYQVRVSELSWDIQVQFHGV